MSRTFRLLLALLMAAALSACSSVPKTGFSGEGTVQSIREISEPSTFATLAGAIGGAAIGGGLGADGGDRHARCDSCELAGFEGALRGAGALR